MWRLDTTPAIWSKRDEVKNKRVLLELIDVKIPDTFSWTREADRRLILGSYGDGPMSKWLQPPPNQTCCGYCYAVSTAGSLGDRLAIQGFTPRDDSKDAKAQAAAPHPPGPQHPQPTKTRGTPIEVVDDRPQPPPEEQGAPIDVVGAAVVTPKHEVKAPESTKAPPCYVTTGAPGLSPVALASCVSAAHPDGFLKCGGGAVDHRLGDFLEKTGVPPCIAADASAVKCPGGGETVPDLPVCPDAPSGNVRSRPDSFTLLKYNHTIKSQILQGPVVAAFRCPSPFVHFGKKPIAYQHGSGSYGGWHPVHGEAPWTHAFAWHGPSDSETAGHAITLVGYLRVVITDPHDPSKTLPVEAWVARNSFGLDWGDAPHAGAAHKGYCLFVSTSSGYNGALGIGECQDSESICRSAFDCTKCLVDKSGNVTSDDKLPTYMAAAIHCDGCKRESVGAAVFDADVEAQGGCGPGDFVTVKDTCKGNPQGKVTRRCKKWKADRPSIEYACDVSRFYINDYMKGSSLRTHEDDEGGKKTGPVDQPHEVSTTQHPQRKGLQPQLPAKKAAPAPPSPPTKPTKHLASGEPSPVSTPDQLASAPSTRTGKLSGRDLALVVALPIVAVALGGAVAAVVVLSRRV